MSFVSEPAEGAEIIRQLVKYDGLIPTRLEFGRLYFVLDVIDISAAETARVVDELNGVDDGIDVYVNGSYLVVFDYYVTADLVPVLRGIVNGSAARLRRWSYTSR